MDTRSRLFAVRGRGFALAFATVAVVTGVKFAIGGWAVEDAEVLFSAAVSLTAWRAGTRPALAAMALSAASQALCFIPSFRTGHPRGADALQLGLWVAEAALLCALFAALDRAKRRAIQNEDAATQREGLLTASEAALRTAREGLEHKVAQRTTALVRANGALVHEIGIRMRTEERLRESDAAHRLLFEANPMPMYVFDTQTTSLLAVNAAATRLYGYSSEEFLSKKTADLKPRGGSAPSIDPDAPVVHVKSDGTTIEVQVTSGELTFQQRPAQLEATRDVTQERRLQEQLRQTQKMEAVGRLAGGVAHDFNNMLTILLGYTMMLLDGLSTEDALYGPLSDMKHAGERATDLTRQLLAFTRQQPLEARAVDINATVDGMNRMLHRLLREDIEIVTHLAPSLGTIHIDPGQLEQVVMNIVVNARDAMPDGGKLTIETALSSYNPNGSDDEAATPTYVMLAISDTGSGMDAATKTRIFEPFFTTKEPGKGTGLGLSIVFGIVQQYGGHVWVYSEPGKGSTFKLYFPLDRDATAAASVRGVAQAPVGGSETVLLVEDEAGVRAFVETILRRRGYRVISMERPDAAMSVASSMREPIDLLLTDVVMPAMSGRQLAERLLEERPSMKVLYMSGYTDNVVLDRGLPTGVGFMQKPVTPMTLTRTVRDVLDAADGA